MSSCPFTGKASIETAAVDKECQTPPCGFSRTHGFGRRNGDEQPTGSAVRQGKFGRMFPNLPPLRATNQAMEQLGLANFGMADLLKFAGNLDPVRDPNNIGP